MEEEFTLTFTDLIQSSLFSGIINFAYAFISVGMTLLILRLIDCYILKEINFLEEIKKGNIAAALFSGLIILSISLVIALSMR